MKYLLVLLLGLAGFAPAYAVDYDSEYPHHFLFHPVTQASVSTAYRPIEVVLEIAYTETQMSHGLMHRWQLPERHGMIFLFTQERPLAFWMKNTYLSLDIVFVNSAGRIISIAENTLPLSVDPIASQGPVSAVIELAAGSAKRLHIAKGDTVNYSWFHE